MTAQSLQDRFAPHNACFGCGPANALGQVKFLFPNPFAIYMHNTPKKKLFERPVRAFSHGCMRTENPVDQAAYCWAMPCVDSGHRQGWP